MLIQPLTSGYIEDMLSQLYLPHGDDCQRRPRRKIEALEECSLGVPLRRRRPAREPLLLITEPRRPMLRGDDGSIWGE